MKNLRIFYLLLGFAALASCSKNNVANEIGNETILLKNVTPY